MIILVLEGASGRCFSGERLNLISKLAEVQVLTDPSAASFQERVSASVPAKMKVTELFGATGSYTRTQSCSGHWFLATQSIILCCM